MRMPIKIEKIPALNIINFYMPQPLTIANKFIVATSKESSQNVLLRQILQINGIERCLIADNLIGIKYNESSKTDELTALALAEADDYISTQPPLMPSESDLSLPDQVEALADSFIRPTLIRDNGNIHILSVTDNTVFIRFTGHCAGCPYAQNTLNNVIGAALKKYLPQIQHVQTKED